MPSGKALDVATLAQTVLDGVVAHYATAGVALPDYRAILPGDTQAVAWDTPAVLVTMPLIRPVFTATTGTGAPAGMLVREASVRVQIARDVVDVSGQVSMATITAAGLALALDMGLLSQVLLELCGPSGPLAKYGRATVGDVVPVGPSGKMVAVEGSLAVSVLGTVGP